MTYLRRDDGFYEDVPNHATILGCLKVWLEKDMPENLVGLFDMYGKKDPIIVDISGKREDCEDPDQTSGGDDCGDTRGG